MTTKQFQIFKEFTERMKTELEINSHKGDWVPWKNQEEMLSELRHHQLKLIDVIDQGDISMIREHSADVANISLFIYNSILSLE